MHRTVPFIPNEKDRVPDTLKRKIQLCERERVKERMREKDRDRESGGMEKLIKQSHFFSFSSLQ